MWLGRHNHSIMIRLSMISRIKIHCAVCVCKLWLHDKYTNITTVQCLYNVLDFIQNDFLRLGEIYGVSFCTKTFHGVNASAAFGEGIQSAKSGKYNKSSALLRQQVFLGDQ